MNHAQRKALYQQIETERSGKVLALVTSERVGMETQIAPDAVNPLVSLLDKIGPTKKICLVIDTLGGQTSAAWRLINLIRSFGDEVEVVIPNKAMSAGTIMSIGADRIVMTKQAVLGPIDPSIDSHPLMTTYQNAAGQQVHASVSAEAVRGYIEELRKDVTEPAALASAWIALSDKVHPLVLGQIFRLGEQIRTMAASLIERQVTDPAKQKSIIQFLCSDSGSHDFTIDRRKAKELGLNVDKPSAALYVALNGLSMSYTAELKTFEPLTAQSLLGGQASSSYALVRGLIESEDECYGFVTDGEITLTPGGPQPFSDVKRFEGWRKLP